MKYTRGRPREYFRVKATRGEVTICPRRKPDKQYGKADVYIITSSKDIDFLIRELKEARDRAFFN